MNKAKLFKTATIILAVSFFVQVITVAGMIFLKDFLIRLGALGIFFEIHEYNGFLFVALILAHLFFNRGWIRSNILKKIGE